MHSTASFVVVFDLDGTLYSSEKILGGAYATAVVAANRRWKSALVAPNLDAILALVGRPVGEILANLFPEMPEERRHDFSSLVLADLVARIEDGQGEVFEGVPETLTELRALGHPLAVVSNCRRAYLEAILGRHGLAGFLEDAACNEDDPALGKNGFLKKLLAGRRGVMVGDRSSDGVAARFAGVKWIGCSYGHGGPVPISATHDVSNDQAAGGRRSNDAGLDSDRRGHAVADDDELRDADAVVHRFPEILPIVRAWATAIC